ncbi:hypothetical protein CsSME_00012633 [Camellia sinensis var. sinensis]
MFIFIARTSRRKPPSLSLFFTRHHLSSFSTTTTTTPPSSNLHTKYSFKPPLSLHQNPNPNPKTPTTKKPQKPPYRPPSSLDRGGAKPVRSDLPFDFRFSYTESNPDVRPIGLREPKYSPFGPDRLDRVWTGVCAPAVGLRVGSVEDGKEESKLEEKRKKMREKTLGEPLTNAERKALVDRCHSHRTKRQINLGIEIFFLV